MWIIYTIGALILVLVPVGWVIYQLASKGTVRISNDYRRRAKRCKTCDGCCVLVLMGGQWVSIPPPLRTVSEHSPYFEPPFVNKKRCPDCLGKGFNYTDDYVGAQTFVRFGRHIAPNMEPIMEARRKPLTRRKWLRANGNGNVMEITDCRKSNFKCLICVDLRKQGLSCKDCPDCNIALAAADDATWD